MKNYKLKQFERNHYYYGKLLSVNDFLLEQNYFNSKRYTINRTILGGGVVFGLLTGKSDEFTVNVSSGMAIDDSGREIVVPSAQEIPIMSAISSINAGTYVKDSCYEFYLCMEYNEHGDEKMISIADIDLNRETAHQHNHIHESFKFSILPENTVRKDELNSPAFRTVTIYKGNGLEIQRQAPAFVNPGEIFEVTVKVKNTDSSKKASGRLIIDHMFSGCELFEGSNAGSKIIFSKEDLTNKKENSLSLLIKAGNQPEDIKIGTFIIELEGIAIVNAVKDTDSIVHIIDDSVSESIMESYFDYIAQSEYETPVNSIVYLAKLTLRCLNSNDISFSIEQIEDVPHPLKHYIYNNNLLYSMIDYLDKRVRLQENNRIQEKKHLRDATYGFVVFEVGGDILEYTSEKIDPGLGREHFCLKLGLLQEDTGMTFCGDKEVLNSSDKLPDVSLGAFVDGEQGNFTIRIKIKNALESPVRITVRWWAFKADAL